MKINKTHIVWFLIAIALFSWLIHSEKAVTSRDPQWDTIELNDDGSIKHCPCPSPEPGPTPTTGNMQ